MDLGLPLALPFGSLFLASGEERRQIQGQDLGIEGELVAGGLDPVSGAGGVSREQTCVDEVAPERDMVDAEIAANFKNPQLERGVQLFL